MKLKNRINGLLALLMMGSASLQARGGDPFDDVNPWQYQGNMTITAQVVQNGLVATTAVVAAFCEDELRGKAFVGNDENNPGIVYLTIYGKSGESNQSLYFKVFADGHIFTFNPQEVINWKNNDILGSTSNPYIIDITPVCLEDKADNTTTLTTYDGKTCDVMLTDRTLYKDGQWNTLCLPFEVDLSAGDCSLAGAEARPLISASITETTLNLTFGSAVTTIAAGTPYIIKWPVSTEDITNPVFTGVTIDNTDGSYDNGETGEEQVRFVGTYGSTTFSDTDNCILLLGGANMLHYPTTNATIGACRAYFKLGNATASAPQLTMFNINFSDGSTTGILQIDNGHRTMDNEPVTWFMIDGRRLNGLPAQRGVYVRSGKKVVIK